MLFRQTGHLNTSNLEDQNTQMILPLIQKYPKCSYQTDLFVTALDVNVAVSN